MLLKFVSVLFLFTLLPASYAHAGVAPQLGVGTPKRSDVKRPGKQPCGDGVNIASTFDKSTAVPASSNGEVKVTVLNFNPGADGSRQVRAQVDPSGTGKNFVKMTIIGANGDPAPKDNKGSQDVVAKLPTGTKCTGGSTKNKCLVQFVTTSGFGNCVVVSQGGAGDNNPPKARAAGPRIGVDISDRGVDAPASTLNEATKGGKNDGGKGQQKKGDGKRKQKKKKGGKKKQAARAAGPSVEIDISDRAVAAGGKSDGGKGQQKKGDGKRKQKKGGKKKKQAGTRAPRALLVDLEA